MCAPLTPHDDIEPPTLADKASAAFNRLLGAIATRHALLVAIDEGRCTAEFPRGGIDERLKDACKEAFQAEYDYQQAAHDLMTGGRYAGSITSLSLALAMQMRLGRNDAAARSGFARTGASNAPSTSEAA